MPSILLPASKKRKLAPAPTFPSHQSHDNSNHATASASASPPSSPSLSSASVQEHDNDDDDYRPSHPSSHLTAIASSARTKKPPPPARDTKSEPAQPTGKAKGKGKGKSSSREALRKANHSLIERRRREKINAALGELRGMVPGLGEEGAKAGEFKLEVLERTVAYMKELKDRLETLEANLVLAKDEDKGNEPADGGTTYASDVHVHAHAHAHAHVYSDSLASSEHGQTMSQDRDDLRIKEDVQVGEQNRLLSPSPSAWSRPGVQNLPFQHHSPSPSPLRRHIHDLDHIVSVTSTPDPNETDVESNLPPPLAKANRNRASPFSLPASGSSRSSPAASVGTATAAAASGRVDVHSVASLLASAQSQPPPPVPSSRPPPPAQNNNPIFLPFPAPSPTSPFLSMGSMSSNPTSTASSTTTLPDPSPFLAPLQNISLFGGVFNLDATSAAISVAGSPTDTFRAMSEKHPSPPEFALPPARPNSNKASSLSSHSSSSTAERERKDGRRVKAKEAKAKAEGRGEKRDTDMAPEEAANLLLAFSSPDTLRPQQVVMINPGGPNGQGGRRRRLTLDDGFSLDPVAGGRVRERGTGEGVKSEPAAAVGKSARDILRMDL